MLAPAILALAAEAYVPPRVDIDILLRKPVSPGTMALLVTHLPEPRAVERVMAGINHADPAVRATAARVAGVVGLPAALTPVRTALDTETDRSAAAEQLRASVFLGRPGDDLGLLPIARKHGIVDLLGVTVAAARGPAAIPVLDAFVEAGLHEAAEKDFMRAATHGGREGLNVAATGALRSASVSRWSDVLALARRPGAQLSSGLLVASIGSLRPEIRALTYWHLAITTPRGSELPTEIEAAIARTSDSGPDSDNDARFALVAVRRAQKGVDFGGDWGERAAAGKPAPPMERADLVAPLLTKAEAAAISRRLTGGKLATMFDFVDLDPPNGDPSSARTALWLSTGLPAGTLRDMMAVTGCKPGSDRLLAGLVRYRFDGRPRQVSVADRGLPQPCAQIAGPALGLSLTEVGAGDPAQPDQQIIAIVPLQESALECAEPVEQSNVARVTGDPDGTIREPRKVKNVPPIYPDVARAAGTQGVVVLEAVISRTGCVSSMRLRRGVSAALDMAAMSAVSQWRYTPTLLNGTPVPVIMTVTVNFRLS
jgi:TonB family protein